MKRDKTIFFNEYEYCSKGSACSICKGLERKGLLPLLKKPKKIMRLMLQ